MDDAIHTLDDVRAALADGRQITGVGVSARLELAAHALNNEGSRNNATIPRQVDVVAGGEILQVNAISGDTIKHAFVDYLRDIVADTADPGRNLPLCEPCRLGDPNRLNADPEFQKTARQKSVDNGELITELIDRCTIDDIAGLLVTQGNRNAPRRSTVLFGWELGIPDRVRTGRYTHVKLVPGDPSGGEGRGARVRTSARISSPGRRRVAPMPSSVVATSTALAETI